MVSQKEHAQKQPSGDNSSLLTPSGDILTDKTHAENGSLEGAPDHPSIVGPCESSARRCYRGLDLKQGESSAHVTASSQSPPDLLVRSSAPMASEVFFGSNSVLACCLGNCANQRDDCSKQTAVNALCLNDHQYNFLFTSLWPPEAGIFEICSALPNDIELFQ